MVGNPFGQNRDGKISLVRFIIAQLIKTRLILENHQDWRRTSFVKYTVILKLKPLLLIRSE